MLLILLLVISLFFVRYFTAHQWILNFLIIINFIIWFCVSQRIQLKYLAVTSIIALLFTSIYLVFQVFVS